MIKAAILGYGTVGSGVYKVLTMNRESIAARVGEEIEVAHVLDLREFPGDPAEGVLTHDFNDILSDPEVSIVVETMGGLKPAYSFTKAALEAGKSVCTSNKELVAEYGSDLLKTAAEHGVNYLFEASCGGGIPVIHAINEALTADCIMSVSGIVNGTTNYILTQMGQAGQSFDEALADAQKLGYAELHPEADVEGYDAQRKIAILSTLAYGRFISYKDVPVKGITEVTKDDIDAAARIGGKIKLVAESVRIEGGVSASVAPAFVGSEKMLYNVDGVMNAVALEGNAVGDLLFYGSGAGSLPTASAVAGDVVSLARTPKGAAYPNNWGCEKAELVEPGEEVRPFFVRFAGSLDEAAAAFGEIAKSAEADGEADILTAPMAGKEADKKAAAATGKVIKMYRA